MTLSLTGDHQPGRAAWLEAALFERLGGKGRFDEVDVRLVEAPAHAATQEQSSGRLHVTVKSPDERLAGKAFRARGLGRLPLRRQSGERAV